MASITVKYMELLIMSVFRRAPEHDAEKCKRFSDDIMLYLL